MNTKFITFKKKEKINIFQVGASELYQFLNISILFFLFPITLIFCYLILFGGHPITIDGDEIYGLKALLLFIFVLFPLMSFTMATTLWIFIFTGLKIYIGFEKIYHIIFDKRKAKESIEL